MSNSNFNDPWYLHRKFRTLIKLSAVSLLAAPAALMADVISTAGEMCRVYMVHDGGLNNSQMLVVDIPVAKPDGQAPIDQQPFKAEIYGLLLPGFDIEAMDMRTNETGGNKGLFLASGDDTDNPGTVYIVKNNNPAKIGQVCNLKDPNTGVVVVEGCVAEIDGISFAPNDNCMLGWGQDVGLFKVCLNDDGNAFEGDPELLIPAHGEFEDLTWNMDGSVLYAVENDWDFVEEPQFHHLDSSQTTYTNPGTGVHPYFHVDSSYYQPDPSMKGDHEADTKLWRYVPATGDLKAVCASEMAQLEANCDQLEIEALDAIPSPPGKAGDTLAMGYHKCSNDVVSLTRLNVSEDGNSCTLEQRDEVQVDFSVLKEKGQGPADIEGIGWPCSPWGHTGDLPCENIVYAKDSATDSTAVPEPEIEKPVSSPINVGNTDYEIYGLAMKQVGNSMTLAVNSNLTLAGQTSLNTNVLPNVEGSAVPGERNISFGDFIIEITKENDEGEEVTELYGIYFVVNNDSPAPEGVGLYKIEGTQFVTGYNYPWMTFYEYNEFVDSEGGNASLAHVDKYAFGMFSKAPIAIDPAGAVKLDEINVEVLADKSAVLGKSEGITPGIDFTDNPTDEKQGLDFDDDMNPGDANTFGVNFQVPEEWKGATNIRISLFVECANDGIVLEGQLCDDEGTASSPAP